MLEIRTNRTKQTYTTESNTCAFAKRRRENNIITLGLNDIPYLGVNSPPTIFYTIK